MISTREVYKGLMTAFEKKTDYLLPLKTTQIKIPYSRVKEICEKFKETIERELQEETNPWELNFGEFSKSDLDNDISDRLEAELGFVLGSTWEDC